MQNPLYILLPPLFVIAGYTEMKSRRIPNFLTVGALICALAGAFITAGPEGLESSAIGMAIGGGVFLPFCLAGVLGGGDLKLMAAVGATLGYPLVWSSLYYTCLAGGALGLLYLIWSGQLVSGMKRVFGILIGRAGRKEREGLRKEVTLPYGIAIAAGTLTAIVLSG